MPGKDIVSIHYCTIMCLLAILYVISGCAIWIVEAHKIQTSFKTHLKQHYVIKYPIKIVKLQPILVILMMMTEPQTVLQYSPLCIRVLKVHYFNVCLQTYAQWWGGFLVLYIGTHIVDLMIMYNDYSTSRLLHEYRVLRKPTLFYRFQFIDIKVGN